MPAPRSARLSLRRLWRHVHPDLFARWPEARATNQRAMQELQGLLQAVEVQQHAAQQRGAAAAAPPAVAELRFFVQDAADEGGEALREVSTTWRSPSRSAIVRAASQSPAELAGLWRRSAEGCMATLLERIDPTDAAALESAHGGREGEAAASSAPLFTADQIAAERRRRRERGGRSSEAADAEAAAAAAASEASAGGQLHDELLFFDGVDEDGRARATALVASLLHEVWPAGEPHSPILVLGGPAPPLWRYEQAAAAGFACVRLDALDADALRLSLDAARHTAGGHAASERRADAEAVLAAGERLRAALGCEGARTEGGSVLTAAAARRMCDALLRDARGLRAATDAPWGGLHLELRGLATDGGGERGGGAVELVDGHCGGCTLLVRGEAGAASALEFVRREWRSVRRCTERFELAEALRERLGCAAVECAGAPTALAAQGEAMRRLLAVLREEPVLLPAEGVATTAGLADVTIRIGGDDHAAVDHDYQRPSPPQRAGQPPQPRVELRLPSDFASTDALSLLVSIFARPPAWAPRAGARPRARRPRGERARVRL